MKYYYMKDGQEVGPVEESELISVGVTRGTLVWHYGMPMWAKAGEVSELAYLFNPEYGRPPIIETVSQDEQPVVKQKMFSRPFRFSGRIRALEYALSYIFYIAYCFLLGIIFGPDEGLSNALYDILWFPALIWILSQGTMRCHDRGHSGWYQIIPFYWLWMIFGDGDAFENEYGPDPKGRDIE